MVAPVPEVRVVTAVPPTVGLEWMDNEKSWAEPTIPALTGAEGSANAKAIKARYFFIRLDTRVLLLWVW